MSPVSDEAKAVLEIAALALVVLCILIGMMGSKL